MSNSKFKVSVRCFTYNQAEYITDTMNGFCMQKTNFPYICMIVDDASTDGEQEVIKDYVNKNFLVSDTAVAYTKETDYAQIIYAQHKDNSKCFFVVLFLRKNHYSQHKPKMPYLKEWRDGMEYEAMCEGDDYWIDPYKLQKQIDIMEANPDCMLTFHAIREIYMQNHSLDHIRAKVENREYSGVEWFLARPAQFASFMHRLKIYDDDFYNLKVKGKFPAGDIPLLLACARIGKIIGISDVMSVYRHNNGGWTAQERTKEDVWKIANSHLKFEIFGNEYKNAAQFFFQRECIGYFLNRLKSGICYWEFLRASLRISLKGTIKCVWLVMNKRYV